MPLPITIFDALAIADDSYNSVTYSVNDVECFVLERANETVVSFRGTEGAHFFDGGGWKDLLRDFRAIPWKDKRVGWCHAGILKGARLVTDKYLIPNLNPDKPVVLVGHSLGGGLTVVAASFLKHHGFNVTGVITFGSPRVLYKSALRKYRKRTIPTWQYSNPGDPVTAMPARFLGLRHVRELITTRHSPGIGFTKNHVMTTYHEAFASEL